MIASLDHPRFDPLNAPLRQGSPPAALPAQDPLEALLAGVQRVSEMADLPLCAGAGRGHSGWANPAWAKGMASLAWLMEHRAQQCDAVADSPRHRPECLRLRALVALIWWQGYCPSMLTTWGWREMEALCARHGAWLGQLGDRAGELPPLLTGGPRRAVRGWMDAARITEGRVLRRILPCGTAAPGALSSVGARSLFANLVADAREVGLVDAAFALNFRSENPTYPLGIAIFATDASRWGALRTEGPSRPAPRVAEGAGRHPVLGAQPQGPGGPAHGNRLC